MKHVKYTEEQLQELNSIATLEGNNVVDKARSRFLRKHNLPYKTVYNKISRLRSDLRKSPQTSLTQEMNTNTVTDVLDTHQVMDYAFDTKRYEIKISNGTCYVTHIK